MERAIKPPSSFWAVAIFALLWNLIEIYFSSFELEFLKTNLTSEEFQQVQSVPIWYVVVFIIALLTELIGSFMLFMRKKLATNFFAISLIALLFVEIYWLFIFEVKNTSIVFSVIIPVVVIGVAVFLYLYSKSAAKKGWFK